MNFSQINFYNWNVFSSKTEKANVVEEIFRIAMKLRLRQKKKISQIFFNWNEFSAKTEKVVVLEKTFRNALIVRIRQKMKFF